MPRRRNPPAYRLPNRGGDPVRLDLVGNPYGPCPAAAEALLSARDADASALSTRLTQRIAARYRLSPSSVLLTAGADAAIDRLLRWRPGPVVSFAPSSATELEAGTLPDQRIVLWRGPGRFGMISAEFAADLPPEGAAVVASPSDPLGQLLAAADAVRLARALRLVVVDERFAEFAGFSLLPLALEFDNVAVVRTFGHWVGDGTSELGWVAGSPRVIEALIPHLPPPAPSPLAAALATLDDLPAVEATLRLIREERSRLFRLLRKFSFLRPLPSWGPFVPARIEGIPRDDFVAALGAQHIRVHAPAEVGLEQFVRIGIGTRSEMEALRSALTEIAPEMIEGTLRLRCADPDRLPLRGEQRVEAQRSEVDHVFEVASAERPSFRR
jgi:histidinol-phosphate aminotransferase